MAKYFPLRPKA